MGSESVVSIITVCFNAADTIRDTLDSIQRQTYPHIQHILVDGGSSDETVRVIQDYTQRALYPVKWISEPDKGIYDALNKGISMADGGIIGILHADDLYGSPDVIEKIVSRFAQDGCDGVYGNLAFVAKENLHRVKRLWVAGHGRFSLGWSIPHQTLYLKREVYETFGNYRTELTNAADNEYILRICKDGRIKTSYIDDILVVMKMGGASTKNLASNRKGFREVQEAYRLHGIKCPTLVNILRFLGKGKQVVAARCASYKVEW